MSTEVYPMVTELIFPLVPGMSFVWLGKKVADIRCDESQCEVVVYTQGGGVEKFLIRREVGRNGF